MGAVDRPQGIAGESLNTRGGLTRVDDAEARPRASLARLLRGPDSPGDWAGLETRNPIEAKWGRDDWLHGAHGGHGKVRRGLGPRVRRSHRAQRIAAEKGGPWRQEEAVRPIRKVAGRTKVGPEKEEEIARAGPIMDRVPNRRPARGRVQTDRASRSAAACRFAWKTDFALPR